jgi:hypothetical protein
MELLERSKGMLDINLSGDTIKSLIGAVLCIALLVAGFVHTSNKKGGGSKSSDSNTSNDNK